MKISDSFFQGNFLEWLTALGTFGAVLITLFVIFYEKIKDKINKAVFNIRLEGPIPGSIEGISKSEFLNFSIVVKQVKGRESSDVECIIKKVWRHDLSSKEKKENWQSLPISNLSWISGNREEKFSKGVERSCKLLTYLEDDPYCDDYPFIRINTVDNLKFSPEEGYSLSLPINNVYKFRLELVLIGKNVKSKNFCIDIFINERRRVDDSGEEYIEKIEEAIDVKIV